MVFASGVQTCLIDGCEERSICRGLCRSHYNRWHYSGSPVKPVRSRMCKCCGVMFPLESSAKEFCSATCRKRWERRRKGYRLPARSVNPIVESKPVDAGIRSGMVYEPFTEADVWAGCDGTCVECGKPVSRDFDSPVLGVPAWIVPLEDGGEPSLANKGIFHYGCVRRHTGRMTSRDTRHGLKAGGRSGRKRKKGGEASQTRGA